MKTLRVYYLPLTTETVSGHDNIYAYQFCLGLRAHPILLGRLLSWRSIR